MKNCIICNNLFKERNTLQICCSKICTEINQKNYNKNYKKSDKYKAYFKNYTKTDAFLSSIKKFNLTKHRKDYLKEYRLKYKLTNNYAKAIKKYNSSDKYKKIQIRYRRTSKFKEQQKEWFKTPKGLLYMFNKQMRRRESLNNIIEKYTQKEWNKKILQTEGICPGFKIDSHYVGIDKLTLDHTFPIAKAHKNYLKTGIKRIYTIDDIQPLCKSCNSRKTDKI
jgi:hypothetical protein